MNAWLLTWEGTSGPLILDENKIVAIVSSKRSTSFIEDLADVLYCRTVNSAGKMAYEANKSRYRKEQYKNIFSHGDRVFYGKNPCIFARLVSNLRITKDDEKMVEVVCWTEPAYCKPNPLNFRLEIVEPEQEKKLVRPLAVLARY
jgi:hypothetical protein